MTTTNMNPDRFDCETDPLRADIFAVYGENDGEWIKSNLMVEARA